jgi:anti-sigma factor RsiW
MSTDRTLKTDKELWQSLVIGPVASTAVSDMDFAAWLEGRLSETEAARIEAAVAADPEMRLTAMDLSEILGMPLPAAPARMAVRAQALVGFEVERQRARRGWLAGLFDGFALPRAVMAAATVVVAIAGFMMGGGLGESYAQEKHSVTAPTTQGTNELTSFFTADGI